MTVNAIVLMYHRIAQPGIDPYGLAVSPANFSAHLDELSRLACVVPLSDARVGRGLRIAITFDDGYADNATVAAPLLRRAHLPATFFITTGTLGAKRFWWDAVADALLGDRLLPDGVDVAVGARPLWLALHDTPARRVALTFLHQRLRPLPPLELDAVLSSLLEQLGASTTRNGEGLTMTHEQLVRLAVDPLVEVGAHTRTHLQLAGQSEALQRDEIQGSVEDVSRILDGPVTAFAYPFGSLSAVGPLAPTLVAQAGCQIALTTEPGLVSRSSNPYRLPRLNVQDWTGEELLLALERLSGAPVRRPSAGTS